MWGGAHWPRRSPRSRCAGRARRAGVRSHGERAGSGIGRAAYRRYHPSQRRGGGAVAGHHRIAGARGDQWVRNDLLNGAPPAAIDARIQRVVAHIRQHIGTSRNFSLVTLAQFAGLSHSRFMHLFTQAVGAPLRPYLRWLRVQRAACELVDGARISTAAHRAGFADAAHLNRTFRRMLGMTPSYIAYYGLKSHGLSLLR